MSILKSGEVGNISLNRLKEDRKMISEKWGGLGLLDGLSGHVRDNVAQLFENQAAYMINESTDTAGSNGAFETVAFPIIRRVFSKLLANDIVSVQALSLPIGKLFFLNPKISTTQTTPDGAYENAATDSSRTQFEGRSLYEAYYGNTDFYGVNSGLYDRSKGKATVTTVSLSGITYNAGDKFVTAIIPNISYATQGKLVNAEGELVDTEAFLASLQIYQTGVTFTGTSVAGGAVSVAPGTSTSLPYRIKSQIYGKAIANPVNGSMTIEIDLSTPSTSGYGALIPITGTPVFMATYKNYDRLEENSEMAEVTFELEEVTVSVTTRKMRAQWTPELAQDVSAFQNIDAEAELTALLSEQVAAEIDREILRDLRGGAAWTARWDYNGLRNQSTTYYGTQKDWNQTLLTKINQISAQIHKSTLRGGASWIVVSPEVSAVLDDLEYFHVSNAGPEEDKYNMGIEKVGTLGGRYTVYRDPYAPSNTILIGHKGSSILESGYIYAPYVPMQLTPVMVNPFDFKNIRGIQTRYAKKLVNNRFYGKLLVDGLTVFADPLF
jgi:hypothetical protein